MQVLCGIAVPPEQMRLNGVIDGQPVVKRRRGRRKNVEGMDLLFMNRNRPSVMPEQVRLAFLHFNYICRKQEKVVVLQYQ